MVKRKHYGCVGIGMIMLIQGVLFYNMHQLYFNTPHHEERSFDNQLNTPYKIYVYQLPARFNKNLATCISVKDRCFRTQLGGFGPPLPNHNKKTSVVVHDTWQFSLEMIIHNKLLNSKHYTADPEQADVFYIPFYAAAGCFCYSKNKIASNQLTTDLVDHLQNLSTFKTLRKPHIMAIGKIEREHAESRCGLLMHEITKNITFIGIEQEVDSIIRKQVVKSLKDLIVVPYPSYNHYKPGILTDYLQNFLFHRKRNVLILLAASQRRINPLRKKVLEQLNTRTKSDYDMFQKQQKNSLDNTITAVHFVTPECKDSNKFISSWMLHSVFCLQPLGDSASRKSFYDAVTSGCIPVIFSYSKYPLKYPFQDRLDYSKFTVVLDARKIEKGEKIIDLLSAIDQATISSKQKYLIKVAKVLQYSYPLTSTHDDAMRYIIDEIDTRFNISQNKQLL